MRPAISVLVPLHQAEGTIGRCLESLLQQTFTDLDVWVVDDGSTDGGAAVVEEVARRDARVHLLRNDRNRGVAATLNVALHASSAGLVARLDADDEALPQRLAEQHAFLAAHPEVGVCGSFVQYAGRPGREVLGTVPVTHAEIERTLRTTTSSPFFHPSVLMRRDVLLAVGGYREWFGNAEDYDLWLRLLGRCELANLPQPLTRYRLSPAGASLGDLARQRRLALVAKASSERPDVALDDLWAEVVAGESATGTAALERRERTKFATLLAEVGYPVEATRYLVRSRREVGRLAAARFVAGRARGSLRRRLGR